MGLLISLTLLIGEIGAFSQKIRFSLLSPVYTLIATYLVVFYAGNFLYNPAYGGVGATIFVSSEEAYSLAVSVTWLLCAFVAGALLGSAKKKIATRSATPVLKARQLSNSQAQGSIVFGALVLILSIIGNGATDVLYRTGYNTTGTNHLAQIAGNSLLPAAALAFGAASTNAYFVTRAVSILLAVASLFLTLAISTRIFCLVPVLFLAGALATTRKTTFISTALVFAIIAAPFLIVVPLTSRSMPNQGILALPDLISDLSHLDTVTSLHETANNLFVSEAISVASIRAKVEDASEYAWLGINPVPGFMTSWERAQERLNASTPFSAVGDLLRVGIPVGMLYYAVAGFYFGKLNRRILADARIPASMIGLLALSYLFIVMTLQYPLRNATRLIYYMLALDSIVVLGSQFLGRSGRSRLAPLRFGSNRGKRHGVYSLHDVTLSQELIIAERS